MFANPWIAAMIATFAWWFSTGAILWFVGRAANQGPNGHFWAAVTGMPFLGAGIWLFYESLPESSVAGAYAGFCAALLIWGWIELSFLTGVITGPQPRDCPPDLPFGDRLRRAWGTVAYHEVLLAATLAAMIWSAWGAANPFGLWTFCVLFCARISAKLNLFLGVPRINVEFLPAPLSHLPSHFRTATISAFFPLAITGLSFAVACWLERVITATEAARTAGFALLAALTTLALLEHWLMVLRLPDAKLWRWMIPAPNTQNSHPRKTLLREDSHGL